MITIYKALGAVLYWFYTWTLSYGWAILIFGLMVKLIMLPFQMKSKKSMMRTTMLQPRMKELEVKCGTDKKKYQEEVAQLYKDAKVNPMSGCLWTLIPFPILIILYKIVRQPLSYLMSLTSDNITTLTQIITDMGIYVTPTKTDAYSEMTIANVISGVNFENVKAAVTQFFATAGDTAADFASKLKDINFDFLGLNMAQKPTLMFWKADGFAENPVPIIIMFLIPFISAGLTILQTKISQAMQPQQQTMTPNPNPNPTNSQQNSAAAAQQTTKTMMYIMPLMSVYICFIMPCAMGLYWIEQSVLSIIQEAVLNRYYKNKLDAEMKVFNDAQRAKDEEMERKRQETERLRAEGKTQVNSNTSKKRLAAQERNAEDQRQAAIQRAEKEARRIARGEELPDSQEGTRRFARGRAYMVNRYGTDAPEETEDAPEAAETDESTKSEE